MDILSLKLFAAADLNQIKKIDFMTLFIILTVDADATKLTHSSRWIQVSHTHRHVNGWYNPTETPLSRDTNKVGGGGDVQIVGFLRDRRALAAACFHI